MQSEGPGRAWSMVGTPWTDEEKARLAVLWPRPNLSLQNIADDLGRPKPSLYAKALQCGLAPRPRCAVDGAKRAEAIAMFERGCTAHEVCQALGLAGRQVLPIFNHCRAKVRDEDHKVKSEDYKVTPWPQWIATQKIEAKYDEPVQRRCGACRAIFTTISVYQETCEECCKRVRGSRRHAHGWAPQSSIMNLG